MLAQSLGQTELVSELDKMLENNAKTPFDHIQLANKAISQGNYAKAQMKLNQLIEETPYLPEPYFTLAKLHYLKGETERAQHYLQTAIDKSEDQQKKGVYQSKLQTLEQFNPSYN